MSSSTSAKIVFLGYDPSQWIDEVAPRNCWLALGCANARWQLAVPQLDTVTHIVIRSPFQLRQPTISALSRLRGVLRAGVGTDAIDVEALAARGVSFALTRAQPTSVAELALAHLLVLRRRLHRAHTSMLAGQWEKPILVGDQISGSTALVIGFGQIGQVAAQMLSSLGVRVSVVDRSPTSLAKILAARRAQVQFVPDIDTALRAVDAVMLCCPLSAQTHHLLNDARLALVKPTAVIVNVARGDVVDLAAIDRALAENRLAGYASDVHPNEPSCQLPASNHERLSLSPHIGSQTTQTHSAIAKDVRAFVVSALAG